MEQFILVFHFVVAVALIGLVLLQQGKGAEAGASFGSGASQTVFGSGGGWNFFSKDDCYSGYNLLCYQCQFGSGC